MEKKIENILNRVKEQESLFSYLFLVLVFFITWAFHYKVMGPFMIDLGREYLVPKSMNEGLLLYKDLACIYAPLGFQFNALMFKIFGTSLDTLWNCGICSALIYLFVLYNISKMFLSNKFSLVFCSFCIIVFMINSSLFNFIYPYSFSFTYGLTCSSISAFLILKYIRENNIKFLYLASIFTSLAIDFKAEFAMIALVIYLALIINKNFKIKHYIALGFCFLIFPLISFAILYHQGLHLPEIKASYTYISAILSSKAPIQYQTSTGMIFDLYKFKNGLLYLISTIVLFISCYFIYNYNFENKKLLAYKLLFFTIALTFGYKMILQYPKPLTLFLFALSCISIKFLWSRKDLLFLIILTTGLMTRNLFLSNSYCSYGVFYAPFILLATCCLIILYFDKKLAIKNIEKFIIIMLSIFTLVHAVKMSIITNKTLNRLNVVPVIETPYAKIRNLNDTGILIQNMADYIIKNTPEDAKIVYIPEGEMMNVLTNRKPDMMLYSLHQMFIEGFGEAYIENRILNAGVDYIVYSNISDAFSNQNISQYEWLMDFLDKKATPVYKINFVYNYFNNNTMTLYKINR